MMAMAQTREMGRRCDVMGDGDGVKARRERTGKGCVVCVAGERTVEAIG